MPPRTQPKTIYKVLQSYHSPSTMKQAFEALPTEMRWRYFQLYTDALFYGDGIQLHGFKFYHKIKRYAKLRKDPYAFDPKDNRTIAEKIEEDIANAILDRLDLTPVQHRRIRRKLANNPYTIPAQKAEFKMRIEFSENPPKQRQPMQFVLHRRFNGTIPTESTFIETIYPELFVPQGKAITDLRSREQQFHAWQRNQL